MEPESSIAICILYIIQKYQFLHWLFYLSSKVQFAIWLFMHYFHKGPTSKVGQNLISRLHIQFTHYPQTVSRPCKLGPCLCWCDLWQPLLSPSIFVSLRHAACCRQTPLATSLSGVCFLAFACTFVALMYRLSLYMFDILVVALIVKELWSVVRSGLHNAA